MSNQSDLSSINTRVGQLMASTVMMENECRRVMEESMKVQTDWEEVKQAQAHSGDAEKYRQALREIVEWGNSGYAADFLVSVAKDALGVSE